jgi:hypothetical protein
MNNIDMYKLLDALSKMDKKDLEAGIAKANKILQSRNKDDLLNQFNKNKM